MLHRIGHQKKSGIKTGWLVGVLLQQMISFSCTLPPSESGKKSISRNGVAISYQSCGEGDTTLLFVHGWCINKRYWDLQVKYFCPRYRVVTVDLPGFGESGKNRTNWNFDEYSADIKQVIDSLNLKNVVLIGHSMSGDLVLKAGNQYPSLLIGLVGIDNLHEPGSPMNEKQQKDTDAFFELLSARFDSTVSMYMRASLFQPGTDSIIVNRVMNDVFTSDSSVSTQVLRSLVEVSQQEKQLMQGLQHRLYLLNSDVLPVKADSLRKYCAKGFELVTVHGTGHYPMIEKSTEFNTAFELILRKIATTK
jgi:pimeloyl-ACP methyl ester carboxylesterase